MAKQLNTLSSGDYAKWQYELAMLNSGKHDTINPDDYTKVFGNYQDIIFMKILKVTIGKIRYLGVPDILSITI